MERDKMLEISVGLFMLAGIIALVILAMKVSGLTTFSTTGYEITAQFDNIGDLRVRAPVSIAGVNVGQVFDITLDSKSYRGIVKMRINRDIKIPKDSSASIFTQGLLGSNYINLTPGFSEGEWLADGGVIGETHQALVLENLIGQFLYSANSKEK